MIVPSTCKSIRAIKTLVAQLYSQKTKTFRTWVFWLFVHKSTYRSACDNQPFTTVEHCINDSCPQSAVLEREQEQQLTEHILSCDDIIKKILIHRYGLFDTPPKISSINRKSNEAICRAGSSVAKARWRAYPKKTYCGKLTLIYCPISHYMDINMSTSHLD